jgi:hypothetical protein
VLIKLAEFQKHFLSGNCSDFKQSFFGKVKAKEVEAAGNAANKSLIGVFANV